MMKSRWTPQITWTNLELAGLLEDEDSCVQLEPVIKHLALMPNHLVDIQLAIRQMLDKNLNCYDAESKGLILAYKNPKIMSPHGHILHDSCFIHINVGIDLYVFRPEVGKSLKGFVNKIGTNHIGILVHKAFNVSIPKPDRLEQWPDVEDQNEWPGDKVKAGQEVRFTIEAIDFKSRLPYMRGSLHEEDYLRGCKLFNEKLAAINDSVFQGTSRQMQSSSSSNDKKKNNVKAENKRIVFNSDNEDDDVNPDKSNANFENANVKLEPNSPVEEPVKTPSKKRKRQSSEAESSSDSPINKKQKTNLKQKNLFNDESFKNNSEFENHTKDDTLLNGTAEDNEASSQISEKDSSSSDLEKVGSTKKHKKKSNKKIAENGTDDEKNHKKVIQKITDESNSTEFQESSEQVPNKKKKKSKPSDCTDTEDERNYKSTINKNLNHLIDQNESIPTTSKEKSQKRNVTDSQDLFNTDDERNYKIKLKKDKIIDTSLSEFVEPQGIPKKRKKKTSTSEISETDDERRYKKELLRNLTQNDDAEKNGDTEFVVPQVKSKKKKKKLSDPTLMDTEDEREYKSSLKPLVQSIEQTEKSIKKDKKSKKHEIDAVGIKLKTEKDSKKGIKPVQFEE